MKLEKFRVTNFRSIKDSGWVETRHRTILVGRNESGKSNILLALRTLKASSIVEPLSLICDFPADVPRSQYKPSMDVIRTVWSLSDTEREELTRIFPRGRNLETVEVGRGYEQDAWVHFEGLSEEPEPLPASPAPVAATADFNSGSTMNPVGMPGEESAPETGSAVAAEATMDELLSKMHGHTAGVTNDLLSGGSAMQTFSQSEEASADLDGGDSDKVAREWVLSHLPSFSFLEEYPDINGHQNLTAFMDRQTSKTPFPGDEYFEKLLIAAEIDPHGLDQLLTADPNARRQQMSLAGSVITRKMRELWSDRALKIRFDLDGDNFHTMVSDPNSIYDVEINLGARSRGFRWFFSFYVCAAADSKTGVNTNRIMLLDEPGMHLHPLGQRDLLDHLANDFENQVLVTTQSPFMVPADNLAEVRTVSISEDRGTTVSNNLSGDQKTVFPVMHALGAEVSSKLLDGGCGLVVAEVSDLWYLRGISNLIRERGGTGLPSKLAIYPAGGTTEVLYMMALLSPKMGGALVLRSEHPCPDLLKDPTTAGLIPDNNVIFIGDPGSNTPGFSAEVEDLLEPGIYDQLVRNAYKADLRGREMVIDDSEPYIVRRYQNALEEHGLEFSREKVARVFLRAMSQSPEAVVPEASRERFETLFRAIRSKYEALSG
ncbi:MAG: ATP-binding protein [bacterium]|nr:ATP-binding protein [bacterium]